MKSYGRVLALFLLLFSLAGKSSGAQVTTYSLSTIFGSTSAGAKVTDIAADSANRVWFATNKVGVTALSNTVQAPGFPLFSTLTNAGFTPILTSVAFGQVGDAKQENFFMGANTAISGLLYGRMLDTGVSFATDHTLTDELNARIQTTKVNALSSDEVSRIWIATDKGVAFATLPALNVDPSIFVPTAADKNVLYVADADPAVSGGEAFFATASRFYMINPTSPNGWLVFTFSLTSIGGLAVDVKGNLWVAEQGGGVGPRRRILRYEAAALKAWTTGAGEPAPKVFEFNPGDPASASTVERTINVLKVSPSSGEIWVGTSKFNSEVGGAYFQKLDGNDSLSPKLCQTGDNWGSSQDDVDLFGVSCATNGSGWKPTPQAVTETALATRENFDAIFLDKLGNAWLGSDTAIRAVITRNLTLSGTRFIGQSATVTVSLFDDTILPAQASVKVKVDAKEETLLMTPVSPGQYRLGFGFTFNQGSNPAPAPHLFPVDSKKVSPIEVTYTYSDVLGLPHSITLLASWVEIVPFEDDLWLGGGPCLIRSLGR